MINKCTLTPWVARIAMLLAWGCAAPVAPEDPNAAGASGRDPDGRAGSNGGGGRGSGERPEDPIEALPGVTQPLDVPPAGCVNGAGGDLSFALSADIPSVLLQATGGTLHANGTACTDAGGNALSMASVTSITVEGDGAAEGAVILDLGSGDWSSLIERPESIRLAFAGGQNSLVLRGTAGPDLFRHGMRGADLVVDLTGAGDVGVVAAGVTAFGVSFGAGDDRLDDLSELLSERAVEATQQAQAGGAPAGAAGQVAPVTRLSLKVIASGGEGNDWLLGGTHDDEFDGGPGDDVASGLDGDDSVYSAQVDGTDTFNGGPGYDYVSYEGRSSALEIHICASPAIVGCSAGECACDTQSGEPGENDLMVNVEDVTGGSGDDVIHGSETADTLSGGPGADQIFGLGGSDLLYGQGGEDVFDGGADGDYCDATSGEQAAACEL